MISILRRVTYRQWPPFYRFSKLPKPSEFSVEMGLEKELNEIHKSQQSEEKSKVATSSAIIGGITVFLGIGLVVFLNEKKKRTEFSLKIMKLLYYFSANKSEKLNQIMEFTGKAITQNRYDSFEFAPTISFISNKIQLLNQQSLLKLKKLTEMIFFFNQKCKSNEPSLNACTIQLQNAVLNNLDNYNQIAFILLVNGSIKQMYLATKYISIYKIKLTKQIQENSQKNLSNLIQKRNKYYDKIFESRKQSELPQLIFKRELQDKWIKKMRIVFDHNQNSNI